ncbi:Copper transporter 6 [Linum perenne]
MPHQGTVLSSSPISSAWNTTPTATTPESGGGIHTHGNALLHTSFWWGHKNTEILFPGWPGSNPGMYACALIFVFVLAVVVEWLSYCSIVKPGTSKAAAGFFKTGMFAVRAGLSYMVMLSVMSYNGGVFIVAVLGHAVGFVLFGSSVLRKSDKEPDLPQVKF